MAEGTEIKRHAVCKDHKFQDERYGKFMRVFNRKADKDQTKWRCTVCGKEIA